MPNHEHVDIARIALEDIRAMAEQSSDATLKRVFDGTVALPACNPVCIELLLQEGAPKVGVIMWYKGEVVCVPGLSECWM